MCSRIKKLIKDEAEQFSFMKYHETLIKNSDDRISLIINCSYFFRNARQIKVHKTTTAKEDNFPGFTKHYICNHSQLGKVIRDLPFARRRVVPLTSASGERVCSGRRGFAGSREEEARTGIRLSLQRRRDVFSKSTGW